MKRHLLMVGCFAALAACGSDVFIGEMPQCSYADTETATNVPFAFHRLGVKEFRFELDFVATPSNNVQLAFGRDHDADRVLSADEVDMTFAWDCGEWRIVNGTNLAHYAGLAATTNSAKHLEWSLRMKRMRPRRLDVSENGVAILPECAAAPDPWLYSSDWNLLRLTARGVDSAGECARVSLNVTGYTINLR